MDREDPIDREDQIYGFLELAIKQIGDGLAMLGFDSRRLVPPDATPEQNAGFTLIALGRANVLYGKAHAQLLHLNEAGIKTRWPGEEGVHHAS